MTNLDAINRALMGGVPKSSKKKSENKRKSLYYADMDKILQRQKGLCAGKHCKKLHNGKRIPVNIRSHFDHIKPLALRGKDDVSNIQALCANCHQLKTREDRKMISISKKKSKKNSSSNHFINPITGKKEKGNSFFGI